MCRLFGLNAGRRQVHDRYWLLSAPDSVSAESRRNPDGTGIGWFDAAGAPHVFKRPIAAHLDPEFKRIARDVDATTVVSHVRAATIGKDTVANCHPFLIDGRLMAHNGGFGDLGKVDARLAQVGRQALGSTDSERFALLIAAETAQRGGDVGAGITAAAQWLADNVPLYSLNTIVITAGNLWALRYPDQRALRVARRSIQTSTGKPTPTWHGRSSWAEHLLTSDRPAPVVVVASEEIDGSPDWRQLDPGELLHVTSGLEVTSAMAVDHPPWRLALPPEPDPNVET